MKVLNKISSSLCLVIFILLSKTSFVNAQIAVIPFEQKGQHLFIKVKVGKGETLRFIFDTGTTGAIIDPVAAQKAGINKDEHQVAEIAGAAGTGKSAMALNQVLEVGGVEIKNVNFAFSDLSAISKEMGTHFDGLIGYEILNQYVTLIDFERQQILLYKKISDLNTKGYTAIPFEFNKGVMIPRFPITITLENGMQFTGRVMFDTGNAFSLLVSAPFSKFHDFNAKLGKTFDAWGMNPKAPDQITMIKSMSFNGFNLGKMSIRLTVNNEAEANDGYLGIIGLPVITRFNVILNYADKKIYLKPNKTYKNAIANEGIFAEQETVLMPVDFSDITMGGELNERTHRNLDRLQSDIYTPEKVYPANGKAPTEGWPGDYEGRVLMGLILEAQATHSTPEYLAEMIRLLPEKVNSGGYFGPLQGEVIAEQQLSGNSWILRTLCEYYNWKKDPKVKEYIKRIIDNLALPTRGYHKIYPIDPAERNKTLGAAIGSEGALIGKWRVSTDIGTDFVFLDGVVQAYEIVPSPDLKSLIEEMISRYLQMDLKAMRAQLHASLTGLRGVMRYYTLTKNPVLLNEVLRRYELYYTNAMTANYENFNWFDRPEWTEPCAIVDAYLLAVQLWQYTGKSVFLEDAQHIYYNALSNTQKANGGFSLSNCPRPDHNSLKVELEEAWWCCTMRGAEGLARAVQYSYFKTGDTLVVPGYNNSTARINLQNGSLSLKQVTTYPFEGRLSFEVLNTSLKNAVTLKLFVPEWTGNHKLTLNGKPLKFELKDRFIVLSVKPHKGDLLELYFEQEVKALPMANTAYSKPNYYTLNYGPLLLGYETTKQPEIAFETMPKLKKQSDRDWVVEGKDIHLSPVYHLMDPNVSKVSGYARQILFKIEN